MILKSCFPNHHFQAEGAAPGNPAGPALTICNAKAAYIALRAFGKHPEFLFVCVTAPPLAAKMLIQSGWKKLAKKMLHRDNGSVISGALARQFNHWLPDENGWLKDNPLKNVVVIDYYDILTERGVADSRGYATSGGHDSRPSREGKEKAAAAFVPFLNRAARCAGLALQNSDV